MLKILQTINNGWIVSDPAYRGDFNEESHEETVPMDFPGMRVPEVSPMELWEGYKSINPDGIKGRCKNWTSIGPVLSSMDIRLTSTFVRERRDDAVSVGRFSVAHADKVESQLQHFALCLLTGRIGMEEDETKRLTYFMLDEQRCTGREPYNIEEQYRANIPRDKFDGIALALREMGLVRSFDKSLIKVTRVDGRVLWGRIDTSLRIAPVEEPGEMIIPGTELIAPKDAQDRIEALQKYWVGDSDSDDKTMAFKARAAMAWAISTLPPQGKIFTWFDAGGTGKTSFINGFDACFPSKAASVNWDSINKGDFAAGLEFSHLIGKTVSFSDETCQLAKMNGALNALKALSTGATVTARFGGGRSAEVFLNPWQVLFSNTGSVFPNGYAFERRLVQMPLTDKVAARMVPDEMHGNETLGDWLFSEAEVGKTFMALAIAGKRIWEEEFNCKWPKELAKWDGEEDDASDDQFCLPPEGSDIYREASAVASELKSQSNLFVNGLRKLARVWNASDGWFYGDHDADSSVTGRIPKTFILLDEKTPAFNSTHTAGHDPATVSGFIQDAPDGTVKNFAKMVKGFGIEFNPIAKKPELYPGGPNSLRAPHADDSPRWKAVRIVLGVQAYGSAVYEAPEVPSMNEEDVTPTISSVDATPIITPGTETSSQPVESQSTPVDETPVVIPPVPEPISLGSQAAHRSIHATYNVEGDLIPVTPDKDKHPKGKWKNENRANGTATKLTKTWPGDEKACAFIPTGHTVILDLDCHNDGKSGWEVLNEEVGIYGTDAFPETLGELTPSGGIHLLYHVDDLKFVERLKNMSHPKGIEVDVKCDGRGMATCAGSVIPEKGTYKVCSLPKGNRLAEMSENLKSWLAHHDYLKEDPAETERKRKEAEAKRARVKAELEARRALGEELNNPDFSQKVESEFDEAIDSIATTPSGSRNSTLNDTAFYLFKKSKRLYEQYPDGDWPDDESLKERLVAAGIESGLDTSEAIATVQSAWSGVFGGTTTVVAPAVAPVIEPVITPEEDVEVQEVVNEDLKKSSGRGESLFQATGYQVDWRGNFHKTETKTKASQEELEAVHEDDEDYGWVEPVNSTSLSHEELEAIHENDEWGNGLFSPEEYDGWCKLVDKLSPSQEESEAIHEDDSYEDGLFGDDGIDGWGNPNYDASYPIIPLDEEPNPVEDELNDPHTNGSRFEDLFDEDESDGWVNAPYDVYDVTYPIIPLDEEIGIDDLGF